MSSFLSRGWGWVAGAAALGFVLSGLGATLTHDRFFHELGALEGPPVSASAPRSSAAPNVVVLPEEKVQSAGIGVTRVEETRLANELVLPATVEVNVDRRVDVRPRVMGMVREVHVRLGDKVRAGDVLAVLDSPDVGTARLDLRAKQLDLSLVRAESEWSTTVAANVRELIDALAKDEPAKNIEKKFANRPLGSRRAELLSCYADLEIARHEEERQTDFLKRGLVGEHPAFVAMHTREAAQAKFEATLEQVRYDALQAKRRGDQTVLRAEAAVLDASQRLRLLGADSPIKSSAAEDEDVTAFPIAAAFDGTITARSAVPSQRVETSDVLFTLTDLATVRVTAHVHESNMAALSRLQVGDPLTIRATAYAAKVFEGKTIHIGTEVNPETRAVTLLAEVPNPEGLLRPGMFARILLEGAEPETALTVPSSAVVELEGKAVVFVPAGGPNQFAARPVETGREAAGRRVILSGLKAGEAVVGANAFTLKCEMVLQNAPETD